MKSNANCQCVLFVVALLACVFHDSPAAQAVPLFDTNVGGGAWNNPAIWLEGGGATTNTPVSGNSVNIDLPVTVTVNASFGDAGENSTWAGGANPYITINPTINLNHVALSTWEVTTTSPFFSNVGIFNNYGTILNSSRFLLGYPAAGSIVNNYGDFIFKTNDSKLEPFGNGSIFYNHGNVEVAMANDTDRAYIWSDNYTGTGQYVHAGGSPITFTKGELLFASPGGINAPLDDTQFAAMFGAIGANSKLYLSGGIDAIDLDSDVTDLSRVRLGSEIKKKGAFRTQIGGTSIKVAGTDGLKFNEGISYILLTPGETMTNEAGSKLVAPTNSSVYFGDSGTFENKGAIQIQNNRFLLGYDGDAATANTKFDNRGLLEFTQDGGRLEFFGTNATFRNLPNGKLRINLGGATETVRMINGSVDNNGQYLNQGGDPIEFMQGTLVFAPSGGIGGTLDDAAFAALFGPINNNSFLRLGGSYPAIDLTNPLTDLSRVSLGHNLPSGTNMSSTLRVAASGTTTIHVTVPGGLKFSNGTPFIDTATGRRLINLAGSHLVAPAGQSVYFSGTGSFENEGLLTIESNRFLFGYVDPGTQFQNRGVVNFTQDNARVELYTGSSMINESGGILRASLPGDANVARIFRGVGTPVSFENKGTMEVTRGIFRVESPVTVSSWTSNSLLEGTYRVLANGNNSTLDLQASSTSVGSFTSIGSDASVVLSATSGNSASFLQLGAISNLQGSFYVHDAASHTVGAAMSVSGTLGGDGTIATPGTITFNGGTLDPAALNGEPGTLDIVGDLVLSDTTQLTFALGTSGIVGDGMNDLVEVAGNLTLDGVLDITTLPGFGSGGAYRLFNYTGLLTDNGLVVAGKGYVIDTSTFGQVNLLLVPEPSALSLLLGGLFLLRRRRN